MGIRLPPCQAPARPLGTVLQGHAHRYQAVADFVGLFPVALRTRFLPQVDEQAHEIVHQLATRLSRQILGQDTAPDARDWIATGVADALLDARLASYRPDRGEAG